MKKSRLKWLRVGALAVVLPVLLTGCVRRSSPGPGGGEGTEGAITISIWRTFDGIEVFQPIINDYELDNPNITLEYRVLPADEYELRVSEALAAGEGPDIWSIRNDWLPRHKNKLVPMPEGLLKGANDLYANDEEAVRDKFVPVVGDDVVIDGRVYGLPYYVDSLVIFRNRDLFDAKIEEFNIADRDEDADLLRSHLNTYDKLQRAAELLTERNGDDIVKSGLAAGTSNNIGRAEDVVYAMMLQNQTEMVSPEKTNASFHLGVPSATGGTVFPGTEALERFTSFADPNQPYYSWNASMPGDIQAFVEGKTAMIFGFQYYELIFDQIAPTLRYEAQALPQVRDTDQPVDYASYWVETVTKNADNPDAAWRVLKDLVEQRGPNFRTATRRPDPRPVVAAPTVIERADPLNPFEFQQQSAIDWYKTKRPDKVDEIFRDLIQRVGTRAQPAQNAIEQAAQEVSAILQEEG